MTFITLEGGDGAGKSTQAELLQSWLESRGHAVVRTREPGGTRLGAVLRSLLLHGTAGGGAGGDRTDEIGEVDVRAEALLYAADRAQHVAEVVRPALERGAVVVQDRYIDSSLAYQGATGVLDLADIRHLSYWAADGLRPELTVLLDLDERAAAERRARRGGAADRFESRSDEYHRAVRGGFLALAAEDPDRYLVLDASLPATDLHAAIVARVSPLLAERR